MTRRLSPERIAEIDASMQAMGLAAESLQMRGHIEAIEAELREVILESTRHPDEKITRVSDHAAVAAMQGMRLRAEAAEAELREGEARLIVVTADARSAVEQATERTAKAYRTWRNCAATDVERELAEAKAEIARLKLTIQEMAMP